MLKERGKIMGMNETPSADRVHIGFLAEEMQENPVL